MLAGGRADRAEGRPARADAEGPAQDRLERAARPVLQADQGQGRPAPDATASARATSAPTTPSRTSTATRSTSTCTARSATRCGATARGTPVQPVARRLRDRAHRAPHPVVDGADARPVAVDADARQLPAGEEGGDGAALADHARSSRATTWASSGSARRRGSSPRRSCPRCRGTSCTARTCSTASLLARQLLAKQIGHEADHHDHRRRADRAHHARRRRVLQLPAGARDGRGDAARGGALHARTASASTRSCSTPTATSRRSSSR